MILRILTCQRGAMFGMDARIALIIASVLAASGGVTMMSRIERSRIETAELSANLLRDAVADHFREQGITRPVNELAALQETGFIKDASILVDPWQNNWRYSVVSRETSLSDFDVREYLITLHSSGKDEVNDTPSPTTAAEWTTWQPENDDIGTKYSTIEIAKERIEEYRMRAKQVIDKLEAYAASNYLAAQAACPDADWCRNTPEQGDRFTQFNFYPQSNLDGTGATYYDDIIKDGAGMVYVSGDPSSMEDLMITLGLPTRFAYDPWGKVLTYHSNFLTERAVPYKPPFTASISYE